VSELAAGEIGEAMAPIFPSDLLGKTFTYDLAETRYEVSTETGAPATGVRFILYAVDPVLRRVTTPLTAVGHLDLTDESTAAAAVLGVKVVISNVTLLDYDAIASIATESVSFEAQGSISDGQATVEFDLIQGITSGPTIALDYQLAVPESGVALGLVASITTANSDISLTVEHEGGTTVIRAEGDEDAITGTVTHDGIVVVTIAGSPDQPDFTDPSGNALSAEQLEALHRLFEHTDRLLDAFDDLLDPAHRLLGIPL
jgi:hypothetical protein